MKRMALLVGLVSFMSCICFIVIACQDDKLMNLSKEEKSVILDDYGEELQSMCIFVSSLSIEEQNNILIKCEQYLQAEVSDQVLLEAEIISLLNLNRKVLIQAEELGDWLLYNHFTQQYDLKLQTTNSITRANANDCLAKRNAALNDLAAQYAIQVTAACLVGPATGGVATAIALAAITAVTEISRQAIHRDYENCLKG